MIVNNINVFAEYGLRLQNLKKLEIQNHISEPKNM